VVVYGDFICGCHDDLYLEFINDQWILKLTRFQGLVFSQSN
jgi:hypothetical protein